MNAPLLPMRCVKITKAVADKFVTAQHYSHRPSIFWAGFGLEIAGKIEGVVVYGQPSPAIQKHAFRDRDFTLYELTRLVIQTRDRNAASFLIGRSLKELPAPCAVISYADTEQNHAGIVYQATNWLYTGATVSHDVSYIINGKKTHPLTLLKDGITAPRKWARDNNIRTAPPMAKHRYFFFRGSKKEKKMIADRLTYKTVSVYPKTEKTMYEAGPRLEIPADDSQLRMRL